MSFLDKTFCASPDCDNSCGRKMSMKQKSSLKGLRKMHGKPFHVSYGYFCGTPETMTSEAENADKTLNFSCSS